VKEPRRETKSLEKNPTTGLVVELFGPTLEFLTSPEDKQSDFCVLKGTIPPNVYVPLHSHSDTEDFLVISGVVDCLRHDTQEEEGCKWIEAKAGDYIHVPSGMKHEWRNVSSERVVNPIITTKRLGQFFQEAGRSLSDASKPVTSKDLARFADISARYGYWNVTPEEDAAVDIIPNARDVRFRYIEAGHFWPLENPQETTQALMHFLNS
jgi:quercetin dioxygenase-like cupin family protein